MILSEVIQRISSLYSHGVGTTSTRLTARHIYNKLLTVRSRLLKEKFNKNQFVQYQVLNCIELIDAPISECECLCTPSSCNVKRSKIKLPKILSGIRGHMIDYVMTIDGSVHFQEIRAGQKVYNKGSKYAKQNYLFYILNDYLYLAMDDNLTKNLDIVMMTAIFDDIDIPSDFSKCVNGNSEPDCRSILEKDFPIEPDLIEPLIEIATNELIVQFKALGAKDTSTNSVDENANV
ncbi:hypothetical protein FACS1894195_3910 [Bacteroidia bacterium]|nr:hypothetical protein FACS1894195_3910 [Bacteroidia bacterium]